jgi:phosphatidate cytidylyltransferase
MTVESTTPKPTSPAGRDVPVSIGVAIVLVALIIASLVVVKDLFLIVVIAAILLAFVELARALAIQSVRLPLVPLWAGSVAMIVGAYYGGPDVLIGLLAATFLATLLWRMPAGQSGFLRDATAAGFCVVYLPFLASFVSLLLAEDDGVERVLTFIAVTVASDIGGFAAGVLVGRHPMAPVISPKKTWEGLAGSVVASLAVGVACLVWLIDDQWWIGLALGGAAVVAATLGDLVESMIKRDLGIKDMSNLLPGHGGIMDRLDSLLPTVPVAYVVLHFLI